MGIKIEKKVTKGIGASRRTELEDITSKQKIGKPKKAQKGFVSPRYKPNKAKKASMAAEKQGYYDKEDESLGMEKGAAKSKKAKKARRDESYGKWGRRKTDWSNHQRG
jgi:hypothetical protein